MSLTDEQRITLIRVLDFNLSLTRKNTPLLQPLSLYSSELKGTKQIAGILNKIRTDSTISDNEITRRRYFNSLANQSLVRGSAEKPILTDLATHYLNAFDAQVDDSFWQSDDGDEIELAVIRDISLRWISGEEQPSTTFKGAWYGAQTFFDHTPEDELNNVLSDRNRLLFLYHINSNGWEIGRYFKLTPEVREEFHKAFNLIPTTDALTSQHPIEVAAAQYKDAAKNIQADIRFRISGFLNAYRKLTEELQAKLPRLNRQLVLRMDDSSTSDLTYSTPETPTSYAQLKHPHQLIVTGCPGSGKSFYLSNLTSTADHIIRTQFHPESSFFDFVGAYKPQPIYEPFDDRYPLEEGDGSQAVRGKPLIDYRYAPGPLMRGIVLALKHPDETVVLLIEEINRGNAAAIFGDVLQLLDRDESGASRYAIDTTPEQRAFLASLQLNKDTIKLPPNLYLWASMNSADQGVFPLDTAFRRRWSYVYKGHTEPCLYLEQDSFITYGNKQYAWDIFRNTINNFLIDAGIHEDKLIGPYFLTKSELINPEAILEKLFLYLWDDALRFRQDLLFDEKSFSAVSVAWNAGKGTPLKLVLPETADAATSN